ncbi:16S rRNA (cytosine(1402)-N(4))-methyltransferase RsmH [Candidatus Daviesbacteria bacterium]|nr:16S rRNA (cytosine(1402)-N(4))-methyltransferase RsmH [Candidatus Daviesbacteria bacterium]
MEGYHRSVLLKGAIDALDIKAGNWYLDCTLGDGGHTLEILKRGGKVVGIDVDPKALERVHKRLGSLGVLGNAVLIQGNFRDLKNLIFSQADTVGSKIKGAIFDLGVSSLQLESPERGFSFALEGPLDMRMDPGLQVRALDLLNTLTRKELNELFRNLGEEKYSWKLADALVSAREVGQVTTTKDLAEVVEKVYRRMGIRDSKIHPATRVFQALRMVINDELGALQEGLDQVKEIIEKNGCIVVISFHSLEDRIVKNAFKQWKLAGLGEVLTRKPVVPSDQEIAENPRSRSAKMRVFKKL